MTLQQLRYIVEVYKCGSITEAAHRLFIAQPSLSKAIKDVEDEFHITILKRGRHGASFTEDGMKFLQFAHRVLDASDDIYEYFSQGQPKEKNIYLSVSSQHYMFPVDALIRFMQRKAGAAGYVARIREVKTLQVVQDVLVQDSQIGILYVSDLIASYMHRLFEKNNLEFIPFYKFPPYVYLSKRHPLAGQKSLTVQKLARYPYVRYEQGGDPYQFSEEFVIPEICSQKVVYVTDRSTMFSILSHTDAYNLGTGCLIPSVASDDITAIPLKGEFGGMTIGWIQLKNMSLSAEMEEYIRLLRESLCQVAHVRT
ncbi:LysR family transcriptional regulator [Megasphaera stantonii]|uniref:LysR family transcriptional regulator n=1 Tax=Megasphaera stantonii TaxID=2144175 RepID=UPI00195B94A9|nr:LysR family transcriptional regulator [Megasphaera stantonii]MBM6732286.1 LysR family transcriptional regulator [Megasphaera stantonii]